MGGHYGTKSTQGGGGGGETPWNGIFAVYYYNCAQCGRRIDTMHTMAHSPMMPCMGIRP